MRGVMAIVLYKCAFDDSRALKALSGIPLRDYGWQVLVYDNSPSYNAGKALDLNADVTYVAARENGGVGAAYAKALEIADANRLPWLMLLDQDTVIPVCYFERLNDSLAVEVPSRVALVPRVFQGSVQVSPKKGLYLTRNATIEGIYPSKQQASFINSGAVISVDFLRHIGGFHPQLWLDGLDHWLSAQVHKHNCQIEVLQVDIQHDLSVHDPGSVTEFRWRSIYSAERILYSECFDLGQKALYLGKLFYRLGRSVLVRNRGGEAARAFNQLVWAVVWKDERLLSTLLFLLVTVSVLDPSGGLTGPLKYLALFAFMGMALVMTKAKGSVNASGIYSLAGYVWIFSVVISAYGIFVHFARGDYRDGNWMVYVGSNIYLFLAVFVAWRFNYRRFEALIVLALCALAVIIWVLFLAGFFTAPGVLAKFGYVNQLFAYQKRQYGSVSFPYIYYFTSPMLVVACAYYGERLRGGGLVRADFFLFLLCVSALFLSGTRNNIIFALAFGLYYCAALLGFTRLLLFVFIISMPVLYYLRPDFLFAMFSSVDYSNSVKTEYLGEYARMLAKPFDILFGYGLGSCVNSQILNACMPVTELVYVDMFRVYGLFGALAYMAMLAMIVLLAWRRSRYLSIGFGAYLIISALNPYLFSTNGMLLLSLVLVGVYSKAYPRRVM